MFCPHCGTQLTDGTRFCHMCGAAQAPAQPAQPVQTYIPPVAPQPAPAPVNSLAAQGFVRKVQKTVRQVGSSPLFLMATICFTFATLLSLLVSFMNAGMAMLLSLFSMIPSLLVMSGLWAVYCTCAGRRERPGTAGLTIIFVTTILNLILPALLLLLSFIGFAIMLFTMNSSLFDMSELEMSGASAGAMQAVMAIMLVIVAIALFFVIFHTVKVCTTISKVKQTIRTGKPNRKVSGFVAVMCFIAGSFSILSGLASLIAANNPAQIYIEDFGYITLGGSSGLALYLSGGASILSALSQIFMGVLIFSYKGKMRKLEEEEARLTAAPAPVHFTAPAAAVPVPPAPVAAPAPIAEPVSVTVEEAPAAAPEPIVAPEPVQPTPVVTPEPIEPIEPTQETAPEENP